MGPGSLLRFLSPQALFFMYLWTPVSPRGILGVLGDLNIVLGEALVDCVDPSTLQLLCCPFLWWPCFFSRSCCEIHVFYNHIISWGVCLHSTFGMFLSNLKLQGPGSLHPCFLAAGYQPSTVVHFYLVLLPHAQRDTFLQHSVS